MKNFVIKWRIINVLHLCLTGFFFFSLSCNKECGDIKLVSPDGMLTVNLFRDGDHHLSFRLFKKKQLLVDTSHMGIILSGRDMGGNIRLDKPMYSRRSELYRLFGGSSRAKYKASTLQIPVICQDSGIKWFLECELSDKGFAFRYHIQGKERHLVSGESSSFRLPDKSTIWYFERNNAWKLKSYAGYWISADISEMPSVSRMGPVQGLPLVVSLPRGGYILLSEAACFDYSGMRLKAVGNNTFKADFTEKNGFDEPADFYTPWRVIMYADNLNKLVNNTLITDLCPAPDTILYKDRSYIRPGKSTWRWWSRGTGNAGEEEKMIRYTARLDFEYVLVDAGWADWPSPWKKISDLCRAGHKAGVGVWIWKASREINDPSDDWASMKSWLDSAKQSGACGIKVDFINAESKKAILFEIALLKEAAKRQLMVDLHGCSKGTGENRTFPNQLTREGIAGLELNNMAEGPVPASHNAALPFTRFVVGPADYTPLGFTAPGNTTWAQQLATLVDFTSPFQVIAEYPGFLIKNDMAKLSLGLITKIPTVWDETIVLKGSKIGRFAAMARRSGKRWFIGIINGGEKKEYQINLSFLKQGRYRYEFVQDDLNAPPVSLAGLNPGAGQKSHSKTISFKITSGHVTPDSIVNVKLAAGGGFVAMLDPVAEAR